MTKKNSENDLLLCPQCNHRISLDAKQRDLLHSDFLQEITIRCPKCGNSYVIIQNTPKSSKKTDDESKKDKEEIKKNILLRVPPFILAFVVGGFFIICGGIFLFLSLIDNLRIGATFLGIGGLCIALITERNRVRKGLLPSERIVIILSLWLFISYLITMYIDITLFLIIFYAGLLIIKEFYKSSIPNNIEFKIKIVVLGFFTAYLMLVVNSIIPYFSG